MEPWDPHAVELGCRDRGEREQPERTLSVQERRSQRAVVDIEHAEVRGAADREGVRLRGHLLDTRRRVLLDQLCLCTRPLHTVVDLDLAHERDVQRLRIASREVRSPSTPFWLRVVGGTHEADGDVERVGRPEAHEILKNVSGHH